ncbi:hypothetical protein AD006_25300 [Pseudonocardia sp. EC080610-09]|uniref:hypothetical protein n=1 Tax=unclassified Pseudonocardia TaxID=2619320 RepID=UPI0006CB60E1|nr:MULTISPECIES: hypothetical protein [unclassified Pseudonocardia]ALE74383.1 hypothetical protein FRP1_17855 [Pseudonocardia sp. EC080625-04]ALL77795.1 hypothetical protein AD006_25300 [Pseudonocardia sp. EC080610-09]ALL80710.1 hypothetical protein AD017_04890 [Pseudonocardia sp. EC080619-01]
MGSVGVLILFMVIGAVICAKARVAGGAVAFSLVALVMFIATPVGSGLPDAIGTFVSAFDQAATPALNGAQQAGTSGSGS